MTQYKCPCETCKTQQINRTERRRMRRALERAAAEAERLAAEQIRATALSDQRIGQRVREMSQKHLEATWTSGDGRTSKVQGMNKEHLLFALAKSYRNEYRDRPSYKREILECEVMRRLAKVAGTERQQLAHERDAAAREARKVLPDF